MTNKLAQAIYRQTEVYKKAQYRYKHSSTYRKSYTARYAKDKASGRQSERSREIYQRDKESGAYRNRYLKKRYGITLEQYNQMLEAQNGVCFLCGKINANGRVLCVDHDHKTGKIRKLLCTLCNSTLGIHEKGKERFDKYLELHKD